MMNTLKKPNLNTVMSPLVFVVEDDPDHRAYLKALLESVNLAVVTFENAEEFLGSYEPWQAGCVLSDVVMPNMSGLELQDKMIESGLDIPILFVTGHADLHMARTAIKKGAVDVLEKPVSTLELIEGIQGAIKKDEEFRQQRREIETVEARLNCLSAREREILDLLVDGSSNKNIANQLNISCRTIETHRNHIFRKMHVNSFPELLRILLISPAYKKSES